VIQKTRGGKNSFMAIFTTKKINTALSVGEKLAAKRQEKGVNLNRAAAEVKISAGYLQALEVSDYNKLPGEVYARNFLKAYARYLGLDINEVLSQYQTEQKVYSKTQKIKSNIDIKKPVERVFWHNLVVTPEIFRNLIIGILIIICLVYLGAKVKGVVDPPFLQVFSPTDNLLVSQKVVEVTGQVEKEATVEINGQPVLTDSEGNFSETLVLQSGTNIIEIVAKKNHSKLIKIYRKVIVIQEE